MNKLIIGLDASRNKSGGAIDHIKGIINNFRFDNHNIKEIHIWSYKDLLDQLPDKTWLIKHNNELIESGIIKNIFWQRFIFKKELKANKCDILFSSDAASMCRFQPFVTLSQDALSFESGTIKKFFFTRAIFRMLVIYFLQIYTMRSSHGTIFLTEYAREIVISKVGAIRNTIIIPHGINDAFKIKELDSQVCLPESISVVYVSNYSMYKNQWNVVKAIDLINSELPAVTLSLIGGGGGKGKKLTELAISKSKFPHNFHDLGRISHAELPEEIAKHNIFLFASSCETISITLLEGMASFKPIACSNKGPMPEVLGDNGVYFDPESSLSIKDALIKIIFNGSERNYQLASGAYEKSKRFSWDNCSRETWGFIEKTFEEYNENL